MSERYSIRAGSGGNESQDWAQMLLTMYMRWAARNGHQVLVHQYERPQWASLAWAGIVRVDFEIDCPSSLLQGEIGIHRLVRTSPFDAERRRHTSFAALALNCDPVNLETHIRSYVLAPYHLVKDSRTKQEVSDVNAVFEGHIEPFIESYAKFVKDQNQENSTIK